MFRTLSACLLGCVVVVSTGSTASAQGCRGRNLIEDMKAGDVPVHAAVRKAADATKNAKNVLWKIEDTDRPERPPSYLFGTIHLSDERAVRLSPAVIEALSDSRQVAIEIEDSSPRRMAEVIGSMKKSILLPQGQTLDMRLNDAERLRARHILASSGLPKDDVSRLRPWVAMLMMGATECEKSRAASGKRTVDQELAFRAEERGMGTFGLETIEDQFAAMSGLPDGDQLALLKASLATHDRVNDIAETTLQLYLTRDLGLLLPLQIALAARAGIDPKAFDSFKDKLLTARNKRMRDRAAPHLARGGLFLGVGALHLIGETGLVALIEDLGYTVTPIE